MGILVAGGCDDSCHEHLDDTLFFSFATQSWQTLPAKVIISNCTFPFVMSQFKVENDQNEYLLRSNFISRNCS